MPASFENQLRDVDQLNQVGHAEHVHIYNTAKPDITPPMMAPRTSATYSLVGRDADLTEIKAALLDGKWRAIAIQLLMGVGKTALACMLANDKGLQEKYPDGVLWASLGKAPNVRAELRRWAVELRCADKPSDVDTHDYDFEAYWRRVVERALQRKRALLVIDDVWSFENGSAFNIGGQDCVAIFTTRSPRLGRRLAGRTVTLKPLSTAQGISLLEQFALEAVAADPKAAELLVKRVGGLPQALIPVACFLRDASSSGQNRRIREAIDKLQDVQMVFDLEQPPEFAAGLPRSLRSVIEASYQWLGTSKGSLDGDLLRRIVERLAVLRPNPSVFCEELAASIADATPETLDALCDAGLIEARDEHYTMHRTFAEYLSGKLSSEKRRDLHLRATSFYRQQLNDLEKEYQRRSSSDYGMWYRYENREWGDAKDNWLYHLSRAGEYQMVMSAFLRAWFDGFWWWGCFLEFHFCDQLLREWEQRETRPESREALRLLTRFKDVYPKETEDRYKGDWPAVETILDELGGLVGLVDPALPRSEDACHLRGLMKIFLAEARRFGKRDHAGAECLYRQALEQFIANGDDWDTAWTYYHLADALVEIGRHDDAVSLCDAGLPLGEREKDPEVQANLSRVRGDIALAGKRYDEAAAALGQAVRHAYRFQVEPVNPDPYTICFYAQVAEQVCARVIAFYLRAPLAARALAAALREGWHSYWNQSPMPDLDATLRSADVRALAAHLFPAALAAEELGERGSAYAEEVKAQIDRLG